MLSVKNSRERIGQHSFTVDNYGYFGRAGAEKSKKNDAFAGERQGKNCRPFQTEMTDN